MSAVTALIAEDEAPQRAAMLDMLAAAWPALDVVAVCEDGVSALEAAKEHRPAVAFLDIRMPGVNGLDVARAVVANGGLVVFTTAYDDYAIRAFEAGAADYLLKPVQPARLAQALERLQVGGTFDVLISDVQMPAVDGIALAEKGLAAQPRLRVILISGFADELDRAGHLKSKVVRIVAKPITLEGIRAVVKAALA